MCCRRRGRQQFPLADRQQPAGVSRPVGQRGPGRLRGVRRHLRGGDSRRASADARTRRVGAGVVAGSLAPRIRGLARRLRRLHVGDATGRTPRVFLPEREHATGPLAWSPDGTRIAFTGEYSLGYSRCGEGFADHLWAPRAGVGLSSPKSPASRAIRVSMASPPTAASRPGGRAGIGSSSSRTPEAYSSSAQQGLRAAPSRVHRAGPEDRCPCRGVRVPTHAACASLRDVRVLGGFARRCRSRDRLHARVERSNAGNEPATNVRVELESLANARLVSAERAGECDAAAPRRRASSETSRRESRPASSSRSRLFGRARSRRRSPRRRRRPRRCNGLLRCRRPPWCTQGSSERGGTTRCGDGAGGLRTRSPE